MSKVKILLKFFSKLFENHTFNLFFALYASIGKEFQTI